MMVHGVGEIPASAILPNIAMPAQASGVATMAAAYSQATAVGDSTSGVVPLEKMLKWGAYILGTYVVYRVLFSGARRRLGLSGRRARR